MFFFASHDGRKATSGAVTVEWALTVPMALLLILAGMNYVRRVRLQLALEDAASAATRVVLTQHNLCFAWLSAMARVAPAASDSTENPLASLAVEILPASVREVITQSFGAATGLSVRWQHNSQVEVLNLASLPGDLQSTFCQIRTSSVPGNLTILYTMNSLFFGFAEHTTTLSSSYSLMQIP